MSNHSFTSITINSGFSARIHRDRNNDGMSLITAIGNYTGGNLLYWEDDNMTMSLDEVARHEPRVIDLRDQLLLMNGKCAHAVEEFEGTRYSIVLYTQGTYGQTTDEDIKTLKQKKGL